MRTQITNMRNERRGNHYLSHGHLKDTKGILGTILCPKFNNVGKMNQFHEIHKLPKLRQEK